MSNSIVSNVSCLKFWSRWGNSRSTPTSTTRLRTENIRGVYYCKHYYLSLNIISWKKEKKWQNGRLNDNREEIRGIKGNFSPKCLWSYFKKCYRSISFYFLLSKTWEKNVQKFKIYSRQELSTLVGRSMMTHYDPKIRITIHNDALWQMETLNSKCKCIPSSTLNDDFKY